MEDIRGEEYKLAGISVRTKGTLVDVFATFAGVNDDVEKLQAESDAWDYETAPPVKERKEGEPASMLDGLKPLPRATFWPELSTEDIVNAVVGPKDLKPSRLSRYELTDKSGVIADLGPEKLAQVLVEMGKARKQVLEEGQETFVPAKAKSPAPKA